VHPEKFLTIGPAINSDVATGWWTGMDMSTPLLLEVAPEIDSNPTNFYRGEGEGVYPGPLGAPPPDPRYRLALSMSVHPTYFDLAAPLTINWPNSSVCMADLREISGLVEAEDNQSEISFSILQGTLPWQPVIVGFIHRTDFCHASG